MYVLQLLRFLGHDIACPIGYLIDCSAVEELSKRNSEPPGEHFLCWFHHFRSKRRPCNRCESYDEVCSEVSLSYRKLTILDFETPPAATAGAWLPLDSGYRTPPPRGRRPDRARSPSAVTRSDRVPLVHT